MLALEVEFLTGVVFAADNRGDGPDWPPQPDRLFSALVASWAARGENGAERAALEWLEQRRNPPRIEASEAFGRKHATVFVPPNDDTASSSTILPHRRRRQPRHFPASLPRDPVIRFVWEDDPDEPTFRALRTLARDTSYLGHSASLVRCHLLRTLTEVGETWQARRRIHPGRLETLCRNHKAGVRPEPGPHVPPEPLPPALARPQSGFGSDWIVFAHDDGFRPDPVAAALAAKTLMAAVLSGYRDIPIPDWVSGHQPDGAPLKAPHLAAVPLMDVGWEWSQGHLMGMALILPRFVCDASARSRDPEAPTVAPGDAALAEEEAGLYRALARANANRAGEDDGLKLDLRLSRDRVWGLAYRSRLQQASLKPRRYCDAGRVWATATPIALDRHPKAPGDVEASIGAACVNIGLPSPVSVVPGKHSAIRGSVSARRSQGAPDWTDWRLPRAFVGRRLTHAVVTFAKPVAGPVILGAGRFCGLGLCLPLDGEAGR